MNHLILADLDHTLFDTDRFLALVVEAVATRFKLNEAKFRDEVANRAHGEAYDLYGHLGRYGIDPADAREKLHQALTGHTCVYPDVPGFMSRAQHQPQTQLAIVTVGVASFQQLKLDTSPELQGLPATILEHNKGRWLAELWHHGLELDGTRYEHITLIDDMPATFEALPPRDNLELVQIVRPTAKYPRTQQDGVTIMPDLSSLF